jgi:streptomycin 6-kinase
VLDTEFVLDDQARRRLTDRFGAAAGQWCDRLPVLAGRCCLRWGLDLDTTMAGGTSCVFAGRKDTGRRVVLKLTPDPTIAASEAAALRAWAAIPQAVELLDADLEAGALLLEELNPGTKLSNWPGPLPLADVSVLLTTLRNTPASSAGPLPTLTGRIGFLFGLTAQRRASPRVAPHVPQSLIQRSHQAALALAASGAAGLVHGDLHPGNVLDAGPRRGLVAIDPRPCTGDPDFDAVDWALASTTTISQVSDRISQLGRLVPGLDTRRLWQWCTATAVIIAVQHLHRHPPSATTALMLQLAAST